MSTQRYYKANQALEHAGVSGNEFMMMHLAQSSQTSTASKKRKSVVLHDEPRSMSTSAFVPTQPTSRHDIASAARMDRQHGVSAPASMGFSRKACRQPFDPKLLHAASGRPSKDILSSAEYERHLACMQAPQHIGATVYELNDYIASVALGDMSMQTQPDYITMSLMNQHCLDPEILSTTESNYAWSPALSSALSSPCYSINNTDASSMPSANMSRVQSTFSNTCPDSFTGDMSMMRIDSRASYVSPLVSGAHDHLAPTGTTASHSCPPHQYVQALPDMVPDTSSAMHHVFGESHLDTFDFISARHDPHSNERNVAPSMLRNLSNTSSSSSASMTRANKRHHENLQHCQRSIAPALNQYSSSSLHKFEHTDQQRPSEQVRRSIPNNGEDKVQIPKSAERQKRPTAPKLLCSTCNDHPEGFRGQHELERHVSRAHAKLRKVWICVESVEGDGKFLANCKACRTKKRYGAYYNAAAHLRRTHFNPRQPKGSRKSKGSDQEKRGGKGGGDWPPMPHLKEYWMREIEEIVSDDEQLPVDDAEHDEEDECENDQANDNAFANYSSLLPIDPNILSYADGSFEALPMSTAYSPSADIDLTMGINTLMPTSNFDNLMMPCNSDVLSQGTGMYHIGDMIYGGAQGFPSQQTMVYGPV